MSGIDLLIRIAEPSEHQVLLGLVRRASLSNESDREALEADLEMISLPVAQVRAGQVFVAEYGGLQVGVATVLFRHDGNVEIEGLFVEPDLWKLGIGRSLVNACAAYARNVGASSIWAIGNPHAEAFYRACGFELDGFDETELGTGLRLRKSI